MPAFRTPALPSDRGQPLNAQQKQERRIVANLIRHLGENGWIVHSVSDGEERTAIANGDMVQAMEVAFSVDEAWLYVQKMDHVEGVQRHVIYVVLGNGIDCIADHSFADEEDTDGFYAVMDKFDAEDYA